MIPPRVVFGLMLTLGSAQVGVAQTEEPAAGEPLRSPLDLHTVQRDAGEIFLAANSSYERGDFAAAIDGYRELIAAHAADGRVRFNLGNAYLRSGELGRAIAEFRRSRSLRPRDEDIRANLAFARQSTRDAIAPPEPSPILSTLLFWHYRLSRQELSLLAVGLSIVFWSLAILRLFRRQSEVLAWVLLVLLGLLLGTVGSLAGHSLFSQPVAVIVPPEIDAFTAPDTESVVRFRLHAGTELRIQDQRPGWLRIALPDDQQGWIEAQWAEVVDP